MGSRFMHGAPVESAVLALVRRACSSAMQTEFASDWVTPALPASPCTLYVHVPFCEALCPFCSFHRVQFKQSKAQAYFEALRQEIRRYHELGYEFRDVYVGGGTPTVAPRDLAKTLELVRALWPIRSISVETNPNHLTPEIIAILRDCGVERLSVGVQSFDDTLLAEMGRLETYGGALQIAERLAAARGHFGTLNVDLMFNFPHQSVESLVRDIHLVRELGIDQVSFYPLMTAESTHRRVVRELGSVKPSRRHEFYDVIINNMSSNYRASSAWCFSRVDDQQETRTIDEYIIGSNDYVGVGSGAFSFVDGTLLSTTFSLRAYRELVAAGRSAVTAGRAFTRRQRMHYDLLVGLFGLALPYSTLEKRYGPGVRRALAPELAALRALGAVRVDGQVLRLTARGQYYWVLMMAEFFTAVNELRAAMRRHIRNEPDCTALRSHWEAISPLGST